MLAYRKNIFYICITVLILPAVKVVKTADMTMNNF